MADRYWVGGTATWDATAGTKWAATSGGTGGETVPTAADNVFFDASSGANTVTVSGSRPCLSFNATGFTGTIAGTTTPNLQVYGNLTFGSGMTVAGTLTTVSFLGTGSFTITSNGKSFVNVTFNNAGDTWTLQDAFTATATVTLTAGTIALSSYTLTCAAFSSSGSTARTVAFDTGKIVLTGSGTVWNSATATSFTTTGTDRIVEPTLGAAQTITPGSPTEANTFDISVPATAGNFTLTLTAGNYRNLSFANATYTVANTAISIFGNLTVSGTSPTFTAGANAWTFAATGSVTQAVTTNGETLDFPITKGGSTTSTLQLNDALSMGLTRTFTLTSGILKLQSFTFTLGLFSSSNANVRSISFDTGKMVFSGTATATSWTTATATNFTSSGTRLIEITTPNAATTKTFSFGAITAANTLDVTIITGGSTGNITITGNINNFTCANTTYTLLNSTPSIFGNLVISGTSPTLTGNTFTFAATSGTKTITTNGKTVNAVTINGSGGTFELQDALTLSGLLTFTIGTFNIQSYTVTCLSFSSTNSNTRTFNFGTGKMVVTGTSGTVFDMTTATNFVSTGTQLVEGASVSGTLTFTFGSPTEANILNFSIVAAGATYASTGRVNNFSVSNVACTIGNSFTPTIYGDFLLAGTNIVFSGAGSPIVFAGSSGTKTITTNGVEIGNDFTFDGAGRTWQLQDALTLKNTRTINLNAGTFDLNDYSCSVGRFLSDTSSVRALDVGTSEVTVTFFGSPSTTDALSITLETNFSYIGTGKFALNTASGCSWQIRGSESKAPDLRILNCNLLRCASSSHVRTLSLIGTGTVAPASSGITFNIYGDLYTDPASTITFTFDQQVGNDYFTLNFASTSATVRSVSSQNKSLPSVVTFTGVGGSWRFDSNWSQTNQVASGNREQRFELTNGTLDLNGYTIKTNQFKSNGSAVRALNFGAGVLEILVTSSIYYNNIEIADTGGSPAFTCSPGTGKIYFSGGFADPKTVTFGTNAATTLATISNNGGVVLFRTSFGSGRINDLTVQPSANTIYEFAAGNTYTFANFTLTPDVGYTGTIRTENDTGSTHNLVLASGIANCQRLSVRNSNASPSTNTWYAGATSTNGGNNTGWIFANAPQASGNMLMLFA